jgi:hypothetical protein
LRTRLFMFLPLLTLTDTSLFLYEPTANNFNQLPE